MTPAVLSKTGLGFEIGQPQQKCQRRPTLQSLANKNESHIFKIGRQKWQKWHKWHKWNMVQTTQMAQNLAINWRCGLQLIVCCLHFRV